MTFDRGIISTVLVLAGLCPAVLEAQQQFVLSQRGLIVLTESMTLAADTLQSEVKMERSPILMRIRLESRRGRPVTLDGEFQVNGARQQLHIDIDTLAAHLVAEGPSGRVDRTLPLKAAMPVVVYQDLIFGMVVPALAEFSRTVGDSTAVQVILPDRAAVQEWMLLRDGAGLVVLRSPGGLRIEYRFEGGALVEMRVPQQGLLFAQRDGSKAP